MGDLLRSALELTVVGMGMTFLSIGALTLGMYVMTAVFRGKESAVVPELNPGHLSAGEEIAAYRGGDAEDTGHEEESRRRAAAAAVAVALALAETAPAGRSLPSAFGAVPDAWNGFARSLHLSGRAQYDARRFRG